MLSMSDNRQVKNNAVPNQSTDNVEDAFWRLKINENQDKDGVAQSSPYPDRPGEPDCLHYLRTGSCGYGSNCRFNHPTYAVQGVFYYRDDLPERVGQPDCEYFLKTGTCKYGSTCKYHHPKDRNGAGPVLFNIFGYPMRQGEKSCPYYMRTGICKFGVACKFHHPQPASLPAAIPVNGPPAYGPTNYPSLGLPYVSSYPTSPSPSAAYFSGFNGPRLQGSQGYVPVMVSPSQGMLTPQGWNSYMGNLSSINMPGSNLIYNAKNQADAGPRQSLPERPNQPECRYYMNTGTCKYGSDCKYHHPKERMAHLALNGASSYALPSRPGQPLCPDLSTYGFCKFGPNCRFDHPLAGYSYNYAWSAPFDSSVFMYPRMASVALIPETKPPSMPPSAKRSDTAKDTENPSRKDEDLETEESKGAAEQQADSSRVSPGPSESNQPN